MTDTTNTASAAPALAGLDDAAGSLKGSFVLNRDQRLIHEMEREMTLRGATWAEVRLASACAYCAARDAAMDMPCADLNDAIARLEIQRANLWNNCNAHIEAGQHDAADDDAVAIASIDYALRVLHEQRAADGFAQ